MSGHTGPQQKHLETEDRREGKAQARAFTGVSVGKARQAR